MEISIKEYHIKEIPRKQAQDIVVKYHYLHRKAPCSFSFGLFLGGELKGVILYGTPSSSSLRKGICGEEEKNNVLELTRLWVADDVPKNGESYLIGGTLRKVDKEIIVSYADTAQGHVGTVYQATNWIYTGLSAKRTDWTIQGVDKHCRTISNKYTADELRATYGDSFSLQPRSRKHRYVFFNAKSKKRKKELLKKLNYKATEYPKA